nr:MAG TPA: hypothetical protein [Caudoviricetes sp.]
MHKKFCIFTITYFCFCSIDSAIHQKIKFSTLITNNTMV